MMFEEFRTKTLKAFRIFSTCKKDMEISNVIVFGGPSN